jgi:RNA polymerase sigma factor (sigma-70 family)
MATETDNNTKLDLLIERWNAGDESVFNEIFEFGYPRLMQLAKGIFRDDRLHRWEQTDDIVQSASVRILNALKEVKPTSSTHFINLFAMQIRRELADLGRKHFGKHGLGANHHTNKNRTPGNTSFDPLVDLREFVSRDRWDPQEIVMMYDLVDKLPEKEAKVFDLVEVWKMTQEEVAARLEISTKTVSRQLESAKELLGELLLGKES